MCIFGKCVRVEGEDDLVLWPHVQTHISKDFFFFPITVQMEMLDVVHPLNKIVFLSIYAPITLTFKTRKDFRLQVYFV